MFPIPGDQNPDHRQGSLSTRPLSRSRLPYTGLTTTLTTSSTHFWMIPTAIFTTLQVFAVSHGLQSEPHRSFQAVTPNPPRNLTIAAVQVVIIKSNDYRVNILQCIWHCLFLTKSLQTDRISLAGQSSKFEMEDADLLSVHGVPRQVPHLRGSRPESVECSDCCGTYCNHVHPHRPPAWRAVWDSGSIKELCLTCAVLFHFLWPGGLCVPPCAKREAHRSDANNR